MRHCLNHDLYLGFFLSPIRHILARSLPIMTMEQALLSKQWEPLFQYQQSARRGHVFHTLSYLYRKYVVYFGCQAHAPRASVLRERQRMRIHDNILRTRCMNVIVYGCTRFYD